MKLEFEDEIITENQEERMEGNGYSLEIEGYHVFIIDKPIPIKKRKEQKTIGVGVVQSLVWKNGYTFITFELISLNGVN